MKLIYTILALLSFTALGMVGAHAQSPADREISGVVKAMRDGDSRTLSNFFSSFVEITIDNTRKTFSRQQGMLVMKGFFQDGGGRGVCEIKHVSGLAGGSTVYALGTYRNSRKSYEINLFFKSNGRSFTLSQMRFSRKN